MKVIMIRWKCGMQLLGSIWKYIETKYEDKEYEGVYARGLELK